MKFELEHWPNYFGKHTLIRMLKGYVKAYIFFAILFAVCFGLYFFSKVFMGFAIPYTRLGSMVALFGMILGPFLPIISFLQRNKKNPSYGLTKDGFLLNERGWDAAFFNWDEIKAVKEFDHPIFGKELHFEFVSFTKAMNKEGQDKFEQALRREYEIEKQPKKISGQLVKGDVSDFINHFQEYYQAYKQKNPISAIEAHRIAKAYIEEYQLPLHISSKNAQLLSTIEGLEGSFYAFPLEDMEAYKLLVSTQKKSVEGIRSPKKMEYPHKAINNLKAEESIELVKRYLGAKRLEQIKILGSYFYFSGIYEHPQACWIVSTENLNAKLDGTFNTDYVIDAVSKEIVTELTT